MELLRAKTREYLSQLDPILEDLAQRIADPNAINGTLSRDDVRILPLLRSVAVVEGLEFPMAVAAYFKKMMRRIGCRALPRI